MISHSYRSDLEPPELVREAHDSVRAENKNNSFREAQKRENCAFFCYFIVISATCTFSIITTLIKLFVCWRRWWQGDFRLLCFFFNFKKLFCSFWFVHSREVLGFFAVFSCFGEIFVIKRSKKKVGSDFGIFGQF